MKKSPKAISQHHKKSLEELENIFTKSLREISYPLMDIMWLTITLLRILVILIEIKFIQFYSCVTFAINSMSICNN